MSPEKKYDDRLTAAHCRAARALFGWSQKDLARHAGISSSTVADFERKQRYPGDSTMRAIMGALMRHDVLKEAVNFTGCLVAARVSLSEKDSLPTE